MEEERVVRTEEQVLAFGEYVTAKVHKIMEVMQDTTGRPEWVSVQEGFLADLNALTNVIASGLSMIESREQAMALVAKVHESLTQMMDHRYNTKEARHDN
jgi:hypothetical protein